jgi:lipid-A-disaccharide synthase
MKILISAAETSSDQHGAQLLKSLKRLGAVDAFGVGGPRLRAEGLRVVVDARELLSMGFFEILGRLPRILRALRELTEAARAERPDIAVVMDYPDFHFRLAKRLLPFGFPIVYYIPPKVWVWRKSRVRVLKERFSKILTIFPFEEVFYESEKVPARYVGNPLLDELPLTLTREEARKKLLIPEQARVLVLMPGSRPSELSHHLELMLDAALGAAREMGERFLVLLPLPPTADFKEISQRIKIWKSARGDDVERLLELRPSQGDAPWVLLAADAGLIKSGTSTLEAALLGCVHAVVYKTNWFSHFVFDHVIRLKFKGPVGLVNLVYGWKEGEPLLIREYVKRGIRAEVLQGEIISLFRDEKRRVEIQAGLAQLKSEMMASELSPSDQAAREIFSVLQEWKARDAR